MVPVLFAMISVLAVICFLGGMYALVKTSTSDGGRPGVVTEREGSGTATTGRGEGRQGGRVTEVRYAFVAGIVLLFLDLLLVWTTKGH